MPRKPILTLIIAFVLQAFANDAFTAPEHLFKIASLAPDGSVWVTVFKDFAEEVRQKSGGSIAFRIYPGGVMGDDKAMYRKMRVGQLQGGGFTMTGIADIVPDFRVLAIPFLFQSYDEVDHVSAKLQPLLKRRFAAQGLRLVAMTEVGFIYTFSNEPRTTIEALQQAKTWSPSGDPLSSVFLESLGISPIALSIPDVLSSLQTGLIDTVFNSLYGSIVLQWFTKATFVTDRPYGYAYGAFILDDKAFGRLSPEQQTIIEEAAAEHFPALIKQTRTSNDDSRKVLLERGCSFVDPEQETMSSLTEHRDLAIEKLVGNAFSREAFDETMQALTGYRNEHAANGSP